MFTRRVLIAQHVILTATLGVYKILFVIEEKFGPRRGTGGAKNYRDKHLNPFSFPRKCVSNTRASWHAKIRGENGRPVEL